MDPASFVASVLALAEATLSIVEYLHDIKEGGKQRFKLLAEITSLWNVLDNLQKTIEDADPTTCEIWTRSLVDLNKPEGALSQSRALVDNLAARLRPSSRANKLIAALKWPFEKQEAQNTIDQAHRLQGAINLAFTQANLLLSKEIHDHTKATKKLLDEQEGRKIIDWLSPLNFGAQQDAIYKGFCEGTGQWLLDSMQFQRWYSSDGCVMWCAGIAGAGKTLLSSLVVRELRARFRDSRSICLAAFCRFDDPACQEPANILGGLAQQCISSTSQITDELLAVYEEYRRDAIRPDLDVIVRILAAQMSVYERVFIVVDALDELNAVKNREVLIRCLQGLPQRLHILIFSRELDDIQVILRPINHLCDGCDSREEEVLFHCDLCALPEGTVLGGFDTCQACHDAGLRCGDKTHPEPQRAYNAMFTTIQAPEADISRYIEWRIATCGLATLLGKKRGLREEIVGTILASSQTMFLVAKLAVDNLVHCLKISQIKDSLKRLPEGLHAAYDQTLQRIDQQDRYRSSLAHEVLKWALMAQRPLRCAEIEQAVAVEPGMEELDHDDIVPAATLLSLCAGLLTVDYNGYVRWVHYTAEEYFVKKAGQLYPGLDSYLAERCLTFLLLAPFGSGPCRGRDELMSRKAMYPFYEYAVDNWGRHMTSAADECHSLALSFFQSDGHRGSALQWCQAPSTDDPESHQFVSVPPLHFAAFCGSEFAVRHFLDLDPEGVHDEDFNGQTPLIDAAQGSHPFLVKLLLERGARVNHMSKSGLGAIHIASYQGQFQIMKLLLDSQDVDVNLVSDHLTNDPPLILAARAGMADIVEMLLRSPKIDVNVRSRRTSTTALSIAILTKRYAMAEMILKHPNLRIDSTSPVYQAAMTGAILRCQIDLVERMVASGADLEQRDANGLTPLLLAVKKGEWPMLLRRLVELGADPKAKLASGKTIMHLAASSPDMLRMCFSLELHLDVNARTQKSGRTPLHQAIFWRRGNFEAVRLLVENGADVTLRDHKNNLTAWDYCQKFKDYDVADLVKLPDADGTASKGDVFDLARRPKGEQEVSADVKVGEFSLRHAIEQHPEDLGLTVSNDSVESVAESPPPSYNQTLTRAEVITEWVSEDSEWSGAGFH